MNIIDFICPTCGETVDRKLSLCSLDKPMIERFYCCKCNKDISYFECAREFTGCKERDEYIKEIKNKSKLITNYEKIKSMSIEELAEFIDRLQDDSREDWLSIGCNKCINYKTHHYPKDCKELDGSVCVDMGGVKGWLKTDTLNREVNK